MKASRYHEENEVSNLIYQYTDTYPLEFEKFAELDWSGEDEDLICLQALEEDLGLFLSDDQMKLAFDGELTVGALLDLPLEKVARRSTAQERQRMRMYRLKNKAKLKRKANIRKRKIESGAHRVKKRVGTADSGYRFVVSPDAGGRPRQGSTPSYSAPTISQKRSEFDPMKNPRSTRKRVKIRKQANFQPQQPQQPNYQQPEYVPPPPKGGQLRMKKPNTASQAKTESSASSQTVPDDEVNTIPKPKVKPDKRVKIKIRK